MGPAIAASNTNKLLKCFTIQATVLIKKLDYTFYCFKIIGLSCKLMNGFKRGAIFFIFWELDHLANRFQKFSARFFRINVFLIQSFRHYWLLARFFMNFYFF